LISEPTTWNPDAQRLSMAVERLSQRVADLEGQIYQAALPEDAEVSEPASDSDYEELRDQVDRIEMLLADLVDRREEGEAEAVPEPEPTLATVAEPESKPTRAEDMENKMSLDYCRAAWQEDMEEYCRMWGLDPETGR
jgi:hypothetical protein